MFLAWPFGGWPGPVTVAAGNRDHRSKAQGSTPVRTWEQQQW